MSGRPRAIHQVLAALSYGDAIGNDALAIQDHLRQAGYDSEIFSEHAHPRMASRTRRLWEYGDVSSPETVCLFHFSIGSAAGPYVHHCPDRLVIRYHNITPSHWFLGFRPHLVGLTYHGRRELACYVPRAELALAVSEFNRRDLEAAGFSRTGVVPIVPDWRAYEGPPSPVVRRLYDDGRTHIVFVGRIIPNKKIEDLIAVFAHYQRHVQRHSRLLLVGDHRGAEPYLDRLQERVHRLGVQEVVFTGHVDHDELLAYYGLADAFLCLSEHEGYCVPLIEAMAFRIPIVAFDAGAVAETLDGAGILLREKDPETVAELLHQVIVDRALRSALLAGQEAALARLRRADFGARLLSALEPVLG